MTTTATATLAEPVAAAALLRTSALSADVLALGGELIADTIASIAAGAREPQHAALVAARAEQRVGAGGVGVGAGPQRAGGPGAHPNVLGAGGRQAAAPLAAFLNGTAAVALELDEALPTGGHPAAHVVPAALAAAQERGVDGERLVRGVLGGYEVAARLHLAHRFVAPAHPHGAIGAIGAAVAVALVRGSDPLAAAHVAATLPIVATWAPCFEGAEARNAWTGAAAMVGVLACDLAEAGMAGSQQAPAELLGLLTEPAAVESLVAPLDPEAPLARRSWTRVYGAAGPLHTAIESAAQLRARLRATGAGGAATFDSVVVETFERNRKFDVLPVNELSARFSLPYAVAVALTTDLATPARFAFEDGDALALAGRVEVRVADDLEAAWPQRAGARVTVMAGGVEHTASCDLPLGHPDRPLTAAERRARRARLLGPGTDVAVLDGIARRTDVADLLEGIA